MSSPLSKSAQRPLQADTTGDEVQRSLIDLLCQTRQRMEEGRLLDSEAQGEVVHQTRVDMKRVRALLYLVERGLAKPAAKTLHASARALASALSGPRDYAVMLDTLNGLGMALPETCYRDLVAVLGERFLSVGDEPSLDRIHQLLQALQDAISSLDWTSVRREHLLQGLERTGTRGQQLCQRALELADVEALHRWRKWVKVWMYQLQWLHTDLDKPWMLRLKPLGSELGRIHDLDVLARVLATPQEALPLHERRLLDQAILGQRQAALANVCLEARKIYAKPAEVRATKAFQRWNGVRKH